MKFSSIIKPTLALFVICLVVTAALSVTNYYTKDIIANQQKEQLASAMNELFPGGEFTSLNEEETAFSAAVNGTPAGYIYITSAMGYQSDIQVMTALNLDGAVEEIIVTDCTGESPGIGQKVGTDGSFLSRFTGQNAPKDSADAITGATYSSDGVKDAVNEAITMHQQSQDGGGNTGE